MANYYHVMSKNRGERVKHFYALADSREEAIKSIPEASSAHKVNAILVHLCINCNVDNPKYGSVVYASHGVNGTWFCYQCVKINGE